MQREHNPDQEVVERAQGGEQAALAELLQRYRNPVFAFVYRILGDQAAAEDVAQEAFVRAFQHIGRFRFRRGALFSTWLFQLARNAALDEQRRKRRRPTAPLDELARVLNCSVRGAESRLFRARQAVRAQLARQGWV
mgnify:CR=1 FL=1